MNIYLGLGSSVFGLRFLGFGSSIFEFVAKVKGLKQKPKTKSQRPKTKIIQTVQETERRFRKVVEYHQARTSARTFDRFRGRRRNLRNAQDLHSRQAEHSGEPFPTRRAQSNLSTCKFDNLFHRT